MSSTIPAADPVTPARPIPPRPRISVPDGVAVFVVACAMFGFRLGSERHFADESAYVAQSYFADLFFEGRRDDPAWLTYPAVDLPPGAKYLVGLALRAGGFPRPGPWAAAAWYDDTSRRFETAGSLLVARMPMAVLGALGCVAILAIGRRAFGRPAGLVAAGLLIASPLYWLHARRAMSDIPAEALGLIALAVGLAAWSRFVAIGRGGRLAGFGLMLVGGGCAGLAVLSKLNGSIAGMALAAWAVLGLMVRGVSLWSKAGLVVATMASGIVAFATFTALNPVLTAHPQPPLAPGPEKVAALSFADRVKLVMDHRVTVSAIGQRGFPDDALRTAKDKVFAVLVQGFGRFSPLGPRHSNSRLRFDWRQDRPALIWLPLVVAGAVVAYRRGREQCAQAEPPTAWAVLIAFGVALAVVTSFIPLAWDRYFLGIQPGAVLLASAALTAPISRIRRAKELAT